MAKLFISYKHEDLAHTKRVAEVLEGLGHDVWWDRSLTAGKTYREEIAAALKDCDVAIVIWTPRSIHSVWVKDEAQVGQRHGKLLPIMIGRGSLGNTMAVDIPLGFGQIHTLDLTKWDGDPNDHVIQDLQRSIETLTEGGDLDEGGIPYVRDEAIKTAQKFWESFGDVFRTAEIGGLPLRSLFLGTLALTIAGLIPICFAEIVSENDNWQQDIISGVPSIIGGLILLRVVFQFVYVTSGRSSRQFFDSAFTWVFLFSLLIATLTVSLANLRMETPNPLDLLKFVPVFTLGFMFVVAFVRVSAICVRLLFSRL